MIWQFYEKRWKFLMWLPIVLLIFSFGMLACNHATTGNFMPLGTEFAGGKTITVSYHGEDIEAVENALPYASVRIVSGLQQTLVLEIPTDVDENQALRDLQSVMEVEEPSIKVIGPAIAGVFFRQAQIAFAAAFFFMAVVVFILFRSPAPSAAVIFAAATDIITTMAVISVLDIRLSFPVLAALLTIIGYSVDTDILLTTEMLKGDRDKVQENMKRAIKTGLTLTATALAALVSLYLLSGSAVLEEIASVLIIGLIIDMPATWLTNAGILRMWLRK